MKTRNLKGQMLIEALVAMSVLVIAVLGIFSLISRSVSLNRVISDQYVGSYLAAEGIEVVKNIIDSNILRCDQWNQNVTPGDHEVSYTDVELSAVNGAPLRFDSVSGFYQYSIGEKTSFYRTINIRNVSDDEIAVQSKVNWRGRGNGAFDVNVEDHFFNWRDCAATD